MKRRPPADDSPPKQTRNLRSRPTPRWLTKQPDLDAIARSRVLLVLSVLSGEKPVTTAIVESGISRGFYYQLETKALNAMLLALAPGADGDASPDATGLHQRIKDLEEKVEKAEQAQRRAERLLFVQRKLATPSPVKTHRGRPSPAASAAKPTRSTTAGPQGWRSSTTTATTATKRRGRPPKGSSPSGKSATTQPSPSSSASATPAVLSTSTPTAGGDIAGP